MLNTEYIILVILFFSIFLLILKKEKLSKWSANVFSQKEKEKYQQICPKCGSEELGNNFENRANIAYGGSIGKVCKACGYQGQFYIEAHKDIKKISSKLKNKGKGKEIEQVDMTFAKGYTFIAKIFGTLSILFGIIIMLMDDGLLSGLIIILWGIFLLYLGKKKNL